MKGLISIVVAAVFLYGLCGVGFAQSLNEALRLAVKGSIEVNDGRYQKALEYFEKSLEISKKLNFKEGIAMNHTMMGLAYDRLGLLDDSLEHKQLGLKMFQELNNIKQMALTLHAIGSILRTRGQYDEALKNFEESLELSQKNEILPLVVANRTGMGRVYKALGWDRKALEYYNDSLKLARLLNLSEDEAIIMDNIGLVYMDLGKFDKAMDHIQGASKIFKKLNQPLHISTNLNNLGILYHQLGLYDEALERLEESLRIVREHNLFSQEAIAIDNIGSILEGLGQYSAALSRFREALKIFRKIDMPEDAAICLEKIGFIYLRMREYQEAERTFLEQEKEEKRISYKERRMTGLFKVYSKKRKPVGLVEACLATGRNQEALSLLDAMKPKEDSRDQYRVQYYTQYGLALKGIGKLKDSSYELLKAVCLSEEMRQRVRERSGFLGSGLYGGRIRPYRGLVETLSERALSGEKGDKEFILYGKDLASSAFYFSELMKARSLLEAMAESARGYSEPEIPVELRNREQDLLYELSAIENWWEKTYTKGDEAIKVWMQRKEKLKKELDLLVAEMRKSHLRYVALRYPQPFQAENLPLKENELILNYVLGERATYLFIVTKGGVDRVWRIDKGKEELERLVNEFIHPFQTKYLKEAFSPSLGHELYRLLLEEALKDIPLEKNIIIIPDCILGLVPFEALVTKAGKDYKDSQYAGDTRKFTYSQSASILALNRLWKHSDAIKPLFAVGDPYFSREDPRYIAYLQGKRDPAPLSPEVYRYSHEVRSTRREWVTKDEKGMGKIIYAPLPETGDEVKSLASLFGIMPEFPDVLLGILASETNFRRANLKDYRYLHFATHADLPGKVQGIKEPFLLLGQVENKEGDDGYLTLTEVLELKLNARMVVLSACVTGRGKMMEGEGVVNFARAFQQAGARSVVISLWEVASKEARDYMVIFYGQVNAGKTPADALRVARNEMRKLYPNPFYWAVFILHGEG